MSWKMPLQENGTRTKVSWTKAIKYFLKKNTHKRSYSFIYFLPCGHVLFDQSTQSRAGFLSCHMPYCPVDSFISFFQNMHLLYKCVKKHDHEVCSITHQFSSSNLHKKCCLHPKLHSKFSLLSHIGLIQSWITFLLQSKLTRVWLELDLRPPRYTQGLVLVCTWVRLLCSHLLEWTSPMNKTHTGFWFTLTKFCTILKQ